ncbi:MAG: hypothetical protein V4658_08715 [Bacteroidota bacterium]
MLLTEYPLWLGLICLALAAGGSWFLYRNNPVGIEGRWARPVQWLLHAFRFLSLFIISFLLLGPLLKLISTETQKPVIVFAIDNSQSVLIAHDSVELKKQLDAELADLKNELGDEYEVLPYTVGKEIKASSEISFREKESNLNKLFKTVKNSYDGTNLGAVVLVSDGLYNNSENPLQAAQDIKAPVFTVALGDTVQRKDVLIKNARTNQLVFEGNSFPLQVDVAAFAAAAQSSNLTVTQNGKVVFTQVLSLSNNYFNTVNATLQSNQSGTQHIVIEVSKINGEVSLANNRLDVFVNVISGRQKIALLALAPHPDLGAYEKALQQNQNYVVESFIISQQQVPANLDQYNLVILHQLPGWNGEGMNLVKQLKQKNIPLLFVLGSQSGMNYLLQADAALQVGAGRGSMNEVLPVYQDNFSLFTFTEEEQEHIKKLPPLIAPFGNYRINGEAEVLFKQQIGYVKTEYPLIFFAKGSNSRSGFICGEGFWKWRMYDMAISGQQTTNNIIGSTVQYLTSKKDQSRFRINGKKQFDENEAATFEAEVYNESYQLVNTGEVSMVITNSSGKSFNYTFSKTAGSYSLDAGVLLPGNYSYVGSTNTGTTRQQVKGQFIVKPTQVEFAQTTANHQLLNELSAQSNGKLFYLNNMKGLAAEIKANQNIKPVIYQQQDVKSWIELKAIFFILLALLGIEWFIRKWNGSV